MLTILSFPSRHALAHVPTACVTACTSVLTGKQLTFIHICKGISYRHIKGFSFPKRVFDSTLNAIILVFFNSFLRSFHLLCYCCPCLISLYSLFFLTWNLTYLQRKCEILKSNVGYLGSYRYYTVPLTRCLCRKPLLLNYHFAKFTSHLHHSFFHSTVANSCRSILHLCYRKFLRFGTGSVYIDLALKK